MDSILRLIDGMTCWSWLGVIISVIVFIIFIIRIYAMVSKYNEEFDNELINEYQKKMKEER